jgi:hypothetical protein
MLNNIFKKIKNEDELNINIDKLKKIKEKYPNMISIIVTYGKNSFIKSNTITKFLVPPELLLYQLSNVIRKKINLSYTDSLFLFINGKVINFLDETIYALYNRYKNNDEHLHIFCSQTESFG